MLRNARRPGLCQKIKSEGNNVPQSTIISGHNGNYCQPNDLKVYNKGVFLNVEKTQTAFPGPNDLVIFQIGIIAARKDISFVREDNGGKIRDAWPHALWRYLAVSPIQNRHTNRLLNKLLIVDLFK